MDACLRAGDVSSLHRNDRKEGGPHWKVGAAVAAPAVLPPMEAIHACELRA
jgi:hypothetical protein